MKKNIAILLVVLMVITLFAGCSANATTAETENLPVINAGETVPDETEASTEAETTTEKPTETTTAILEATTSALATESSTDSTTKKSETTSKKSETTTKTETTTRGETTTKKSSSSGSATTTKPSTTKPAETTKPAPTTTSHTHNWTAHYAEREVLVQEGFYSETIITPQFHVHETGYKCYTCGKEWGAYCPVCGAFTTDRDVWPLCDTVSARYEYDKHCNETGHPVKSRPQAIEKVEYGDPIVTYDGWVDPIYETEKYIDYYTCLCGAKKNA